MKIYYKEEQFPDVTKYCNSNPGGILHHGIEFIPAKENRIVVGESEAEQEDFSVFWDEYDNFISYIVDVLLDTVSLYILAYLEEYAPYDVEENIIRREFRIEGVDWLK